MEEEFLNVKKYVELIPVVAALGDDDPQAIILRDLMDELWYGMSDEEHVFLEQCLEHLLEKLGDDDE